MVAILGKGISEAKFQEQVVELAGYYRWLIYHTLISRGSHPGFPDLVLVRGQELIFAELKSERGRVSRAQAKWIAALESVPCVDVFVWRPSDFHEINARLARRRDTSSQPPRSAA